MTENSGLKKKKKTTLIKWFHKERRCANFSRSPFSVYFRALRRKANNSVLAHVVSSVASSSSSNSNSSSGSSSSSITLLMLIIILKRVWRVFSKNNET